MATCTLAQWKLRRFLAISSETSEELFKLVFWISLKSVGAQRGINKWHNRSCCMVVVNIKGKRCAWFIVTAHFFDPFNHKCGSLVSFNYKSPCYPTSHTYCTATIQLKSKQSHLMQLQHWAILVCVWKSKLKRLDGGQFVLLGAGRLVAMTFLRRTSRLRQLLTDKQQATSRNIPSKAKNNFRNLAHKRASKLLYGQLCISAFYCTRPRDSSNKCANA